MIGKAILFFAEIACSTWVGNVTGTMVTKYGNKVVDKVLIGTGGTLIGSLLVDSAVENLKHKLPESMTKEKVKKEEVEDGRSEE